MYGFYILLPSPSNMRLHFCSICMCCQYQAAKRRYSNFLGRTISFSEQRTEEWQKNIKLALKPPPAVGKERSEIADGRPSSPFTCKPGANLLVCALARVRLLCHNSSELFSPAACRLWPAVPCMIWNLFIDISLDISYCLRAERCFLLEVKEQSHLFSQKHSLSRIKFHVLSGTKLKKIKNKK